MHNTMNNFVKFTFEVITNKFTFVGSGGERIHTKSKHIDNITAANVDQRSAAERPEAVKSMIYNKDRYVIPGSTLKGLIRSRLEIGSSQHCSPLRENQKPSKPSKKHMTIFKTKEMRFNKDVTCDVCKLFGYIETGRQNYQNKDKPNAVKGRVMVSDAVLLDETQISVKNVKGFGNDQKELININGVLRFSVSISNPTQKEEAMILKSLGILDGHTRLLGSHKYADREVDGIKDNFGSVSFKLIDRTEWKSTPPFAMLNQTTRAKITDAELDRYEKLVKSILSYDEDAELLKTK